MNLARAVSLAGRALPWHGRGHRFESGTVHQKIFISYYMLLNPAINLMLELIADEKKQNRNYKITY